MPKRSKPEVMLQTDVSLFGYVQKLAAGFVDSLTKNTHSRTKCEGETP